MHVIKSLILLILSLGIVSYITGCSDDNAKLAKKTLETKPPFICTQHKDTPNEIKGAAKKAQDSLNQQQKKIKEFN